jgi:hypothetical protein
MPYIKQEQRNRIDNDKLPLNAGELNYTITALLIEYIQLKGLNYQAINDIVGALEGAKLEFYRRVAAPYENVKVKENGDVYYD